MESGKTVDSAIGSIGSRIWRGLLINVKARGLKKGLRRFAL